MSGDRTADVGRLADMLVRCGIERGRLGHLDADNLARVLLPTVDVMRREYAIEHLMAMSELLDEMGMGEAAVACVLRAAALRGTP